MSANLDRWRGRVAVISGASSGIGAEVARALSKAGLRVALGARREGLLAEVAASISPAPVWGHALDVRSPESVAAFYRALDAQWGAADVLINNAGVGFRGALWDQPPEEWSAMLDVNVLGLLRMTQPALQRMQSSGRGHIFNISSMSGHRVTPLSSVYAATKHAVAALTEGLRADLRAAQSRIRVTAVSPGFVETDFIEPYVKSPDEARAIREAYPLLTCADIASAVVYALAAPDHMQVHDLLIRPTAQPD